MTKSGSNATAGCEDMPAVGRAVGWSAQLFPARCCGPARFVAKVKTDNAVGTTGLSSAFEVRVLGDFTVRCDGEPVALPQSRKTRALLAYLAVLEKPQRRERLCEMFWDVPDDPRGALRWSLSKLRQILNADGETRLEADRNTVQLKPGSIALDYDLIRGLSAGCDRFAVDRASGSDRRGFRRSIPVRPLSAALPRRSRPGASTARTRPKFCA